MEIEINANSIVIMHIVFRFIFMNLLDEAVFERNSEFSMVFCVKNRSRIPQGCVD